MTNPTPPLSATLRALREDAGLGQIAAAEQAGLSQSKVSRAERGASAPTPSDVEALCRVYGAPAKVRRELMQMAKDLRETSHSARVILQRGGWAMQERIGKIERTAELIREFAPAVVVGLVQTPRYASALFGDSLSEEDRDRTVRARIERQAILTTGREIRIVMAEGALRWCMGSPAIMVEQLDHLAEVSTSSNVRIGIIPSTKPATVPALHPFSLYDKRAALIGTITATAVIADPANLKEYEDYWDEIQPLVSWGDAARSELARVRQDYVAMA